jgi:hypothetical protein
MLAVLASFDAARSAARRRVLVLMNCWLLVKNLPLAAFGRLKNDGF